MFSRYLGALQVASNTAKVLKVRSSKVLLMPLGTLDAQILVPDPLVYFTSKDMDVSEVVCLHFNLLDVQVDTWIDRTDRKIR